MDINEFVKKFVEIFDDGDDVILTPDSYYKELDEYSSLTALSIIAFADEYFSVVITGKDIRQADTVQDLYDLILERIND